MNLSDYKGILVFAEQRDGKIQNVALELLGKARELAESIDTKTVSAVLIGENVKGLADELVQYGADVVYVVEGPEYKVRSEEHTSELQSRQYLVCRLLLEKKTYKHYSALTHAI